MFSFHVVSFWCTMQPASRAVRIVLISFWDRCQPNIGLVFFVYVTQFWYVNVVPLVIGSCWIMCIGTFICLSNYLKLFLTCWATTCWTHWFCEVYADPCETNRMPIFTCQHSLIESQLFTSTCHDLEGWFAHNFCVVVSPSWCLMQQAYPFFIR